MCFLILLLVGGLIFFAVNKKRGGRGPFGPGGPFQQNAKQSPEDLLADRFAQGEISDEEYWQRLSVLRESKSNDR